VHHPRDNKRQDESEYRRRHRTAGSCSPSRSPLQRPLPARAQSDNCANLSDHGYGAQRTKHAPYSTKCWKPLRLAPEQDLLFGGGCGSRRGGLFQFTAVTLASTFRRAISSIVGRAWILSVRHTSVWTLDHYVQPFVRPRHLRLTEPEEHQLIVSQRRRRPLLGLVASTRPKPWPGWTCRGMLAPLHAACEDDVTGLGYRTLRRVSRSRI
jgi:hypothetical protein